MRETVSGLSAPWVRKEINGRMNPLRTGGGRGRDAHDLWLTGM